MIRIYDLSVGMICVLCTTAEAQRPWEEVGYASPAGGFAPELDVQGVTRPGQLVEFLVTGAAPSTAGVVHVGDPIFASVPEGTLVPAPDRSLDFVTDATGTARRSFVWPAAVSVQGLGVQAIVGGALTRATIGRTLTADEATAYSVALASASGWAGIAVESVEEVLTVQFASDVSSAQDLVVLNSAMPTVDVVDIQANGLSSIVVDPFAAETIAQNLPSLDPADVSDFLGQIPVQLGDTVVRVGWDEAVTGAFETFTLVRSGAVVYDSMTWCFPDLWPPPSSIPTPGSGNLEDLPSTFGPAGAENLFGGGASVSGSVVATCNGSTVTFCGANTDSEAGFMWDAKVGADCQTAGSCCACTFNAGISSGLKSVSIGAGGASVSISGALGYSRTWQRVRASCCP